MGRDCGKSGENVYFRARKEAAKKDARLSSREGAAELLGVSASTIADYELGNTKVVPVDKVALMADLYACPELKTLYCPIGCGMPFATKAGSLEGITVRFLKEFDPKKLEDIRAVLISIAADGVVDPSEEPEFTVIMRMMDSLALALSEAKLVGERVLKVVPGGR